jgi:nucleotide-binding universal stress UspA family protein
MRSILVYADRSEAMENRLQTALGLARAVEGHVSLLVDTPVANFLAMDAMGGGGYLAAEAVREAVSRDDAYADELAEQMRREDVPFDVLRGEEDPIDALVEASRLADLVVLSHGADLASELAVAGTPPILLAPRGRVLQFPIDCVAVAWDGSDEAAAALRGSVPLLKQAGEVHVLVVEDKSGVLPPLDAVTYLSRHGVKAEVQTIARVGSVEESLAAGVSRVQASLLVMGAFGHSRLREFLMGGVTRYFLELEDGPALLFAH